MRQKRWIELLSNYDYMIQYYPRKVNVVADALEHKVYDGLAYIQEVRRPLIRELHKLLDEKVIFETEELVALLAHFQTKSNLVDHIKATDEK